jgi:hypothetical protein
MRKQLYRGGARARVALQRLPQEVKKLGAGVRWRRLDCLVVGAAVERGKR